LRKGVAETGRVGKKRKKGRLRRRVEGGKKGKESCNGLRGSSNPPRPEGREVPQKKKNKTAGED